MVINRVCCGPKWSSAQCHIEQSRHRFVYHRPPYSGHLVPSLFAVLIVQIEIAHLHSICTSCIPLVKYLRLAEGNYQSLHWQRQEYAIRLSWRRCERVCTMREVFARSILIRLSWQCIFIFVFARISAHFLFLPF